MLNGGALTLAGTEWVQHELLAWLPPFKFVDHGYDSRSRNLSGTPPVGLPAHTAEYGGIDLNSASPTWRHELTQMTAPWFNSPVPLASYLAGMATGYLAYSRVAVRGGSDDWSFTVDELLRVTAKRPITRQSSVARGNANVVGIIADTSSLAYTNDGGNNNHVEGDVSEWPEGSISTVHMVLGPFDEEHQGSTSPTRWQ